MSAPLRAAKNRRFIQETAKSWFIAAGFLWGVPENVRQKQRALFNRELANAQRELTKEAGPHNDIEGGLTVDDRLRRSAVSFYRSPRYTVKPQMMAEWNMLDAHLRSLKRQKVAEREEQKLLRHSFIKFVMQQSVAIYQSGDFTIEPIKLNSIADEPNSPTSLQRSPQLVECNAA